MSPRRPLQKLTLTKRRELEVAAAVALDEVMQFHVTSGLKLIELAAGRVSAGRMVDIYIRLHAVRGAQAEMLIYSILAALGQRTLNGQGASLVVEGEDVDAKSADARSLWRVLRGRLRGRVHHDLRRSVELATGAVQVKLLEIHVRHAIRFARELSPTHGIAQAVEQYAVMTEVPEGMRPMLYAYVLDRLAAEELPASTLQAAPSAQRVAPFNRQKPKKVI
jgi:hypothetical protein